MSKATARDVIADKVRPYTFNDKEPPMIADAILSALRSAGLVVVPVEPTEAMKKAWSEAAHFSKPALLLRYAALINAASQEDKG